MKPPSKDAITKALDILLKSIQEENEFPFAHSCAHPLDVIPSKHLAPMVEALGLAKQHLVKSAEDLICRIQHHRNLAAPIHRLPQEIFGMILEKFAATRGTNCEDGLLQLLQVGRIWYHAIVDSPQLWTVLHSGLAPKIARLVIERSKNLPILTLIWNTVEYYDDTPEGYEEYTEILGMAGQNSARFRSIYLRVSSDVGHFNIWQLLEGPTTALEALTVEVVTNGGGGEDELVKFVLSKGAPLKYLNLDDISLNFNSPRLSGLVILSLSRAAVPNSLDVLLQLLSATQRLEQLKLCEKQEISEPVGPGSQVTLGHLKELAIEELASEYCTALLSSIYTPVCSRVHVSDSQWGEAEQLDSLIWQTGNSRTAALLGLTQQSYTSDQRICISAASGEVRIRFSKQQADSGRFFLFERWRPLQMVKLLGEFFSGIPVYHSINLTILNDIPISDPFDLTPWGAHLVWLEVSCPTACLRSLEQLAERTAGPVVGETVSSATGAENWMCPNLQRIVLHLPEIKSERRLCVAALLSLVRTRWSQTDGGPAQANQPAKFVIVCTHSNYKKLRDVEIEVQNLVPSFVFKRRG